VAAATTALVRIETTQAIFPRAQSPPGPHPPFLAAINLQSCKITKASMDADDIAKPRSNNRSKQLNPHRDPARSPKHAIEMSRHE